MTHDLLGMTDGFTPKFVKRYANLGEEMARAFGAYIDDVATGRFPEAAHAQPLDEDVFRTLTREGREGEARIAR